MLRFRARNHSFDLKERTLVMGILNVTEDSFYDGGKHFSFDGALEYARGMVKAGCDIIDVGGQSTRPGAELVGREEELKRVVPLIEALSRETDTPISVDTFDHAVADKALEKGAAIVNDITALGDPLMASVIARYGAGVVLMHMKGTPKTMQDSPHYDDVVAEVMEYLGHSVAKALNAGIRQDGIVIDPGIGFGKTVEHNLIILNRLNEFRSMGRPVLVGVSRKSFIGAVLDRPAGERLTGTIASCSVAIAHGADIIRVHDVPEAVQAARMADSILHEKRTGVI